MSLPTKSNGIFKIKRGCLYLDATNSIHQLSISKYISLSIVQIPFLNLGFSKITFSLEKHVFKGAICKKGGTIISFSV